MKRFGKLQSVLFVLLVAVAAGLWFGRDTVGDLFAKSVSADRAAGKHAKRKGKSRSVPVIVKTVGTARNDQRVEAIGTARAKRSVTLYAEAAGEIVAFHVEAGDQVYKDQVIVELDSREQVLSAKMARAKLVEAERMLGRAKQLRRRRVQSNANVQDATAVYERAQLALEQAQEALFNRSVRAPFAGIVGIPKVETGDRVHTSTHIITVDNRETLIVEFDVAERYLSRLKIGQPVTAKTPSYPDLAIAGTVERLDSRVDPASRTMRVRAAFPNKDDTLRPGVSFLIILRLPGKELPVVPQLALQWSNGVSYVWRVGEGRVEKVVVRSVNRLDDTILIDGDLAPGDLVVVEGVQRLRPNRRVSYEAPGSG